MTAPAELTSDIASVQARISAVQAQLSSLSAPRLMASASGASATGSSSVTGTTASAFADTLAQVNSAHKSAATGTTGSAIVHAAERYLGTPYVWGGESHQGIDCSGLVQASMKAVGIDVPRVAADQQHVGTAVTSLAAAQPGDLLFFGNPAYHVAIYLGHHRLIESPEPGKTVHITDVYQTPTSIRRVAAPGGVAASSGVAASNGVAASGVLNPAVTRFEGQFAAAEARFGLPDGLLAAVAQQESGGNPHAVSPAGARGLMQLMPSTAAGMGVNPDDPAQAITAAARILSGSLDRYHGSIPLALAAYNAGPGAVAQYGGIPPYTETQNYVRSIMSMLRAGA